MFLISAESIHRPEVLRWHNRMIERYSPPPGIGLTILLPCSARKPYSKSKSHMAFRSQIRAAAKEKHSLVHDVILTSPLGLVPRELENVYPAAHYDVPVTGVWSREEREIVLRLLDDYLSKSGAPAIAHVDGVYEEICREAGLETTSGDAAALEKLVSKVLRDGPTQNYGSKRLGRVRAVCDYQFGKGAHKHLMDENAAVKGYQVCDGAGRLIATVDRESGLLALSLEGAKRLLPFGRYTAEVSFKPETESIFAVGIEKADHDIRPRDEVLVTHNGVLVGVGRAILSGREMEWASKGLGIKLRHRSRVHG